VCARYAVPVDVRPRSRTWRMQIDGDGAYDLTLKQRYQNFEVRQKAWAQGRPA